VSSPLDDRIRSVLGQVRATVAGQLEAGLAASTADILSAVNEAQQALVAVRERSAADAREAEQRTVMLRGELEQRIEKLQRGAAFEIEGIERTLGEVRAELDAARQTVDRVEQARATLRQELEQSAKALERFISTLKTLDESSSLGEILEQLAQYAFQKARRTAVFMLQGESLRAWRALGFEAGDRVASSSFAISDTGIVGRAVLSGHSQRHRDGDTFPRTPSVDTTGLQGSVAVPIRVGGSVIAVLYLDTLRTETSDEPVSLDAIDAIASHAGRVLEALTVRRVAALRAPGALRPKATAAKASVGME
jgi:hypothetical protein